MKRAFIILFLMAMPAMAATIYVDAQPGADCVGTYSVANRNDTGSETSYDTPQEAADVSAPDMGAEEYDPSEIYIKYLFAKGE